MKTLALTSLSLVTLIHTAAAQPKPAPAPPAPADKKAPPADKAPVAAPVGDKAVAAMPPKPPEAPVELNDRAKAMAGTWKCTGQAELGGQMMDIKVSVTWKQDTALSKFWVHGAFTGAAGKLPPFKFNHSMTYDATAKKLWRVGINARGGHSTAWGTIADKKVMWEGEARWPGGIDVKQRETEEMVSPKELKAMGEYSKDGGKTWTKDHDVSCKK